MHVYWWPLALGSLGLQLVLHNPPIDRQPWAIEFGPGVWTTCLVALLAVLVRNCLGDRRHRGPWMAAALGVGLNVLVVAANGGYMPQSAEARIAVHPGQTRTSTEPQLRNVMPIDNSTLLSGLGDVIAEPTWLPNANVISIGDVVLGVGIAWWAFRVTREKRVV